MSNNTSIAATIAMEERGSTPSSRDITVIVIGCSVSMFCVLLVLIAFLSSRSLRVKRQHIISINLCISLLIFYIGFIISVVSEASHTSPYDEIDRQNSTGVMTTSCLIGAIFIFAGWFFILLWILLDWMYLSFTMYQRVSRHISHFFIKSSILTYGLGLLILFIVVGLNATKSETEYVNPYQWVLLESKPECNETEMAEGGAKRLHRCWFHLEGDVELIFLIVTSICGIAIICCAVFCSVKLTCGKNKNTVKSRVKKNKHALIKSICLTLIVFITSIPHLALWVIRKGSQNQVGTEYNWLTVLDGVFFATEGIFVVLCLSFRADDFNSYLVAVLKGKDPNNKKSFRLSASNLGISQHSNAETSVVRLESTAPETPKFQPRDESLITLTPDDEVFLSSRTPSPTASPNILKENETEKHKGEAVGPPARLNSLKKLKLRASFRKSKISNTSCSTLPRTPRSASERNTTATRFNFAYDSKASMVAEPERKSSF